MPFDEPPASVLAAAMGVEMAALYGGDSASQAAPEQFSGGHGTFLVARLDGRDVGCGGLRLLTDGVGEIKRMYVEPDARGRGVARALLRALLDHARAVGLGRVQLETGTLQPAAIGLYESEGFTPIAPYGRYRGSPMKRCFAVELP